MKQLWLIAVSFLLLVALTQVSSVGRASSLKDMIEVSRQLIRRGNYRTKTKRWGYSDMSAPAGKLAMMYALRKIALECARNPRCDPYNRSVDAEEETRSHMDHINKVSEICYCGGHKQHNMESM